MSRGEFGKNEKRRARKAKPCHWCFTTIVVGQEYFHWFGPSEDYSDVSYFDSHPECDEAIRRETALVGDDNVTWAESHRRGMTYEESRRADDAEIDALEAATR